MVRSILNFARTIVASGVVLAAVGASAQQTAPPQLTPTKQTPTVRVGGAVEALQPGSGGSLSLKPSKHYERVHKTFTFVPMIGLSSATLHAPDLPGDSTVYRRGGYNGSALIEIGKGAISFQTGLMYINDGEHTDRQYSVGGSSFSQSSNLRYQAFGIPLLAKLNLHIMDSATVYLKGGVIPEMITGSSYQNDVTEKRANGSVTKTTTNDGTELNRQNWLGEAGLGVAMQIGKEEYRAEFLFNRSVQALMNDPVMGAEYASSFMFNVGVGLGIF